MASKSAPNNPNDDLNIVKDNKWALPLIERGLVLCLAMLILNTELSLSHRMTPSDFSPLPSNILMNKEYAGHTLSDCCTLPAYTRAMKACSSNSQLANRDMPAGLPWSTRARNHRNTRPLPGSNPPISVSMSYPMTHWGPSLSFGELPNQECPFEAWPSPNMLASLTSLIHSLPHQLSP